MSKKTINIEQNINAPVSKVWKALTDKEQMGHWFAEVDSFEPRVGFRFSFYTGGEEQKYLHICKVIEVKQKELLSYNWHYEDIPGNSTVRYELFAKGNNTIVRLTHEGIVSFPQDNPLFSVEAFNEGWKEIIKISLKEYVENEDK